MIMKKNKSISASRLPKKEPGKCCNARTKQRVGYCRKVSGWGTGNPGQGRCRIHGGKSLSKHGIYSKILPVKFHELLEDVKPEEITDLTHEIIKLKTLLMELSEVEDKDTEIELDDNGDIKKTKYIHLTVNEILDYVIKIVTVIAKTSNTIEANRERAAKREDFGQEFLKFISPLVSVFYEELEFVIRDKRISREDIPRSHKERMEHRTVWD